MAKKWFAQVAVLLSIAVPVVGCGRREQAARGQKRIAVVLGLTFGADKRHLARAALESIPYQIRDAMTVMEHDSGIRLRQLRVDGGITANRFVMQFLTDLLDVDVVNIGIPDVSALGAALLAGLHEGLFRDMEQLEQLSIGRRIYRPGPRREKVRGWYDGRKKAVQQLL